MKDFAALSRTMRWKIPVQSLPRAMMWTAAVLSVVALLTVIVVQIMIVMRPIRPPETTRWFNAMLAMSSQAIFASIAMAIAGFSLHSSLRERRVAQLALQPSAVPARPAYVPPPPSPQSEPKLPSEIRSALAAAGAPNKRR